MNAATCQLSNVIKQIDKYYEQRWMVVNNGIHLELINWMYQHLKVDAYSETRVSTVHFKRYQLHSLTSI